MNFELKAHSWMRFSLTQLTKRRFNSRCDKDDFAALSNSPDLPPPPPNTTNLAVSAFVLGCFWAHRSDIDLARSHTNRTEGCEGYWWGFWVNSLKIWFPAIWGWDPRTLTALWSWTFAQEGHEAPDSLINLCLCIQLQVFVFIVPHLSGEGC